ANKTWVIDLLFERNKGRVYLSSKSTIRNVDPSKRVLALVNPNTRRGIELVLTQTDPKTKLQLERRIEIKGEPLAFEEAAEFGFKEPPQLDNVNPTEEFGLALMDVPPISNLDNKRSQPKVLLPDESKAVILLAQLKAYSLRNINDKWQVKVLDAKGQ